MIVSLDFETYSELDIKKVGAWAHSMHPSTKILCMAWAYGDGKVTCTNDLTAMATMAAYYVQETDCKFSAFNAGFEYAIWLNCLSKEYGIPRIKHERWIDTAAIACAHSLPREMGGVAQALKLPVQKDEEGKRIMQRMCKPNSKGEKVWSAEMQEKLEAYCIDDVRVEREILKRLGELSPLEQQVWQLDLKINERGMTIDMDLAEGILDMKEKVKHKLRKECEQQFGIRPSQVEKIKDQLRENDVEIPKVPRWKKNADTGEREKVMVESLGGEQIKRLLVDDIPDTCKRLLTIRREYATTSLAKADAVMRQAVDGKACYQFMYHGANTGRWAGKGIQMHNLPRGEFDEEMVDDEMVVAAHEIKRQKLQSFPDLSDMQVLKSALRGMVVPSEDNELVVMDFSQIEARVLPWLAGEQSVLDAFVSGKDLYKFTASQIYQIPYDDVTKDQRFYGKMSSLALGYGGGAGAFISMAVNFGVKVTTEEANKIKDFWRSRNPKIVKFWYGLETAAGRCIKTGNGTRVGDIRFRMREGFLCCHLPSGRVIKYYDPKITKGKIQYKGSDQAKGIKWGDIGTYGGKLSENVTQAVARDLLAEAMIRLDEAGFKIVGHVHDEVILEVKKGTGKNKYTHIEQLMVQTPSWAKGLPVEADGFIGMRYRK